MNIYVLEQIINEIIIETVLNIDKMGFMANKLFFYYILFLLCHNMYNHHSEF
jgi:hypothetical protein